MVSFPAACLGAFFKTVMGHLGWFFYSEKDMEICRRETIYTKVRKV